MGQPLREDLLGYLLGALEPEDHRRVDLALSENEELREELLAMRQQLVPLARLDEWERQQDLVSGECFPSGLARRTCESVSRQTRDSEVSRFSDEIVEAELSGGKKMVDISHQRRWGVGAWTVADYVIASTVAILVMGMIAPALLASRNQSRLLACQNNLRKIGTGLYNYAENNEDRFIGLAKDGPMNVAGAYAPILLSDGYVDAKEVFFCSAAVNDGLPGHGHIPTREELLEAFHKNQTELTELQAVMGGSYGYTLGYYENGDYICPVNLGRSFRVIMADAPDRNLANNASSNHGGNGQNLLFEDGSIKFARSATIADDSIFENRNGLIAAGTDVHDSVIGSSSDTAWIKGVYQNN